MSEYTRHAFMGLTADEWATWPEWSYMTQGPVTPEDVRAAIEAMLRRLDSKPGPKLTPLGL